MAPAGPVGIDRCAMKLQTAALWDNGRMHAELDAKPTDLITINPGTLDDATQWSLRDLQRLCVRLGIPAKGRREQLVARLNTWNRTRHSGTAAQISATIERTGKAGARGAAGAPEGPATVEDDASRPRAVVSAPMPLETSSSRYA